MEVSVRETFCLLLEHYHLGVPDLVHYRIDWSRGACRGDTHPASRAREVYSFSEIRAVELATDEISDQNFDNLDWMQFNKQCY